MTCQVECRAENFLIRIRQTSIFSSCFAVFEQFSEHAAAWRKAIGCLCLLDGLLSLAVYSSGLDGVFPELEDGAAAHLHIEEGRHPCLDLAGDAIIPNDTQLSKEKSLIVLTGTYSLAII